MNSDFAKDLGETDIVTWLNCDQDAPLVEQLAHLEVMEL